MKLICCAVIDFNEECKTYLLPKQCKCIYIVGVVVIKKEFRRNSMTICKIYDYIHINTNSTMLLFLSLAILSISVVVTVEKPVALSYIENTRLFHAVKNFHFHYTP